jgi:hypothetical protein
MKAVIVAVVSIAAVGVSLDTSAQRSGGGGRHYSGGGGGRHYSGGGGGHYYGYRGGHHGHSHSSVGIGFVFGGPLWYGYGWPGYYPYYSQPYYYGYPAAVSVPPVYIERGQEVAAESPYWYYCRESDTYYPYVRQCSGDWERVPAQPAR